jgi:epoxyqueuosine reductase
LGGALFGVCEIDPFKDRFLLSTSELKGLRYGVVIGVVLSRAVFDGIKDSPTLLYKWHYRQANNLLDKIAFILSERICEKGFRALPVPASQVVDWEKQKGHVSHRILGEAAGLGWRGRNNLLVNEVYGSRIRLVSILTNLPLVPDHPVTLDCGSCNQCISACPVGALGDNPEQYDLNKCYDLLTEFSKRRGIGVHICGLCIKECPGMSKR